MTKGKYNNRSRYYSRNRAPDMPGVYLTRAIMTGNNNLTWWRAFDGMNWRAGIMAVDPSGTVQNTAPDYERAVNGPIIGYHVCFEWCGVTEKPTHVGS